MSLYRVTETKLEPVMRTTFAAEKLMERGDVQRLLRQDISPLGDDLMVIAEEYGEWEDSRRRIDLLCLSKDACLVVVEIKRTEDGGHMELQALRYAAMVSSMTLDRVIDIHARHNALEQDEARDQVVTFLHAESDNDVELTGEVRIILVSADFSTELTTSILWLNKRDLDITCVRLRPYKLEDEVLIDATQIIPLPETADYEVKLRTQEKEKRKVLGRQHEVCRRFWSSYIERAQGKTTLLANRSATTDTWLTHGIGRGGFTLYSVANKDSCRISCYIGIDGSSEKSLAAFEALANRWPEIESAFGDTLTWEDLPNKKGCRIFQALSGGWDSPESEWPEIQDRMIDCLVRLEGALRGPIHDLDL